MAPRSSCLVLALLLGGCVDESTSSSGAPGCAPGEWLRDDGVCVPSGLPPDMACPPGEWLRAEDGACIPAGVPPDGCGEGFVFDGDRGCEPILPASPCPDGLMAVPGETSCTEVAPCATGSFGDIPVEPDTEYVDASYTGGASDGSASAPWTSIQAGVDAALAGAIVAVAAGSYVEDVRIEGKPVRLWGVCPALVELAGTGVEVAALFISSGAHGTAVRRLSITGQAVGIFLSGSEDVLVEEVSIHDNASRGLNVQADFGPTSVVVRDSLLERNHEMGMFIESSHAMVETTVVRSTLPDAQGFGGRGMGVQEKAGISARASVTVTRSLLEGNHDQGVFIGAADATLEATVVRDTLPNAQGFFGRGLSAEANPATATRARVSVARSLLEDNHDIGVYVWGSEATLEATVVRGTLLGAHGLFGRGINVEHDTMTGARASVTVARSLLERNHELSVFVEGADATMEAALVRDTLSNAEARGGLAVQVQAEEQTGTASSATFHASVFERSIEAAIVVYGPATADVEACSLRSTAANDDGILGDGLVVVAASAAVTSTRIEQSERAAVSNFGATVALESSLLVCQSFDLGAESWGGKGAVFEDRGGLLCGCPEATEGCVARSYALEPPSPIE